MSYMSSRFRKISTVCAVSAIALTIGMSAQAADKKNIAIAEQPLAQALVQFSQQTDTIIVAPQGLVQGKGAPEVKGKMSPSEALSKLLEGSGLKALEGADGSLSIVPMSFVGGERNSGKKYLPGQNGDQQVGRSGGSADDVHGALTGQITQADTGRGLAGALVRINETGQTTSTDDSGYFRFSQVTVGVHTISISYLGFATLQSDFVVEPGEDTKVAFPLGRTAGDIEEIIVFGSRSARALALNQERTADNMSSVISSDTLGNFTGTTISEALRRVPGVSFQRDPLTGDGTNIMIRGLAPDMNAVKLNGLNLPVGNGQDRSPDLSNLLADSVEKITIHKSLLPSHDSAGSGGLVEIETKSPLSRPQSYANFSVDRGWKGGDFSDDLLLSGTLSKTFGSEGNFGLSASVQYRDRTIQQAQYSMSGLTLGKYLPLEQDGSLSISSINLVNPLTPFPFESGAGAAAAYPFDVGYNANYGKTSNLAITLSGEWRIKDHTNITVDYQRSEGETEEFSRSLKISSFGFYTPQPVEELDGEVRQALTWFPQIQSSQNYKYSEGAKNISNTVSLRGITEVDRWEFNYNLGYARGTSKTSGGSSIGFRNTSNLNAGHVLPGAVDQIEGRIISPFGTRVGDGSQLPLLTDAGWALIMDPDSLQVTFASIDGGGSGENTRYTANFSGRYDIDGDHLKYVEAGLKYESSRAANRTGDSTLYFGNGTFVFDPCCSFAFPSLGSLGLTADDTDTLAPLGISRDLGFVSLPQIRDLFDRLPSLSEGAGAPFTAFLNVIDPRKNQAFIKENNLASYIQARLEFGKLEIVGGARLTRVEVEAVTFSAPTVVKPDFMEDLEFAAEFAELFSDKATVTDILPRVTFNYRESDNLVFRAGYFLSTARPRLGDLSRSPDIQLLLIPFFGPTNNQPWLNIFEGNPRLKPAVTHSFDVSAEYYHDQIGVIKIGAFYKRINNLLQSNATLGSDSLEGIVLPDHPYFNDLPDDIFVSRFKPENNPNAAEIWGFETHVERQFTFLPGFWAGFGMFANYTYTDSSKSKTITWTGSPIFDDAGNLIGREVVDLDVGSVRFESQARHSGTVALTYNMHNIDASLGYSFQSRIGGGFAAHNLGFHSEGVRTLDFRAEYRFNIGNGNYRLYVSGADLLKGTRSPDLLHSMGGTGNTPKYYTDGTYLGGRAMKVGLAASF